MGSCLELNCVGFFRGFFRTVLLQSQTLNAGQDMQDWHCVASLGACTTSRKPVGSEGLASLSTSSLPLDTDYHRFCYLSLSYSSNIIRRMKLTLTFLVLTGNYELNSHLAVRDTFFAPTKQACHLLARPPSVMGLAGNALSSVCTEWAFSVLNAAHQTSGLKSDFPLGCEVPLSQKNSAFKLCKTPFS